MVVAVDTILVGEEEGVVDDVVLEHTGILRTKRDTFITNKGFSQPAFDDNAHSENIFENSL